MASDEIDLGPSTSSPMVRTQIARNSKDRTLKLGTIDVSIDA